MSNLLSRFECGDILIEYFQHPDSRKVFFSMIPLDLESRIAKPRAGSMPESLVQLHLQGDAIGGAFTNGRSMRGSASTNDFHYSRQRINESAESLKVITYLTSPRGYRCEHHAEWQRAEVGLRVHTVFFNESSSPVTLEMLTSFSIGGLSPFASDDGPHRLNFHRFKSSWSAEGRHDCVSLEELHLERSWTNHLAFNERFGQVGTMPVRGWFPFAALEDTEAGVFWGAQVAWAGSWQLELWRRGDTVSLSGGLADRELGHWFKTIEPNGSFATPMAHLTTVAGNLDALCDRLTALQKPLSLPASEDSLPIVFNEYCTTWGNPSESNLLELLQVVKRTPVRYFVIDAGWYRPEVGDWSDSHGDWIPNKELFPNSLAATAEKIRSAGLIPGLWFEFETCGPRSTGFSLMDHLLKLDGRPITVNGRRFWDLNDPWVIDFLTERVISLLKKANFGYIKVDYNETLGIGCDGAESPGEGLRKQVDGIHAFFRRMRELMPELVIENCSSGGHRLEPSMMALTSMASFSDAHETPEIPLIAANLQRLILPRQSQIWAVLRAGDSERRVIYSLTATFLGRMCLSGEIPQLSEMQWRRTQEGMAMYGLVSPIIRDGVSYRFGPRILSMRHPEGWQAILRVSLDGTRILLVAHSFGNPVPNEICIPLPVGNWKLTGLFIDPEQTLNLNGSNFVWNPNGEFAGLVASANLIEK